MMNFMCETVQESSQALSTDKHLEEGGIAGGKELLVLQSSVQDAARCQHQTVSPGEHTRFLRLGKTAHEQRSDALMHHASNVFAP